MKYFILIVLAIVSLQCIAAVYMQKEENGDVTYSDIPVSNAEPVSVAPTNSVPSVSASAPSTQPAKATEWQQAKVDDARKPYTKFAITSPANNDTIQNSPVITVQMMTEPALQAGDVIQVSLDGQPWGKAAPSTSVDMVNVERGEHVLSATLLSSTQQVLREATPVKIYVHRASAIKAAFAGNTSLAQLILR